MLLRVFGISDLPMALANHEQLFAIIVLSVMGLTMPWYSELKECRLFLSVSTMLAPR